VAKVQCTFCGTYNVDPGPDWNLSQFACGHCHHHGTLVRVVPGVAGVVGPAGPPAPSQDQAVATGVMGAAIGGAVGGPVGFFVGAVLGALVGYKKPPSGVVG
jgi:outer membrane lipoprotein SlyB